MLLQIESLFSAYVIRKVAEVCHKYKTIQDAPTIQRKIQEQL